MKIAIIRLSALGDIIQTAVVLQFIKKYVNNASIDWFVDVRFKNILEKHHYIDNLYALPLKDKKYKECFNILKNAKKNNYDLVIDFQGLIKSAFVSKMLSKNNFGFDKNSLKEDFASIFYKHKLNCSYDENVFKRYFSLMNFALNLNLDFTLIYQKEAIFDNKKLEYLKLNEKNILFYTGSSQANKNYPKEKILKLCKLILSTYEKINIFFAWGSEDERQNAQYICSNIQSKRMYILDKLSLQDLIQLSNTMNLIIGNDSGTTHLAFAQNIASITIFGATPSKRNALTTKINKTIDANIQINNAKRLDKNDFCITNIDENDIFKIVKELLQ
ncbi:lipopolysaccharide heptosyltransferase I [Campylobacter canadensis]|uniref:lipopolysaccharide heptosyltransferase I n=1 Tax=Campylobacter canadensis TaxID=449520 RepID=UPI00155194AD|nr:lipopolysaccharide heptosyltransferase I [Campylobacter canadensis]MBZ7994928.1 lipopolysaccharide heptosyltransferase I [Campylobacter canadensis]MBZ7996685.1 lipopolysaccharide heptosyltransferase I [Campylobacter canadensis]MBZ8000345.1 lipopolysaccharide heptosyltransferase I [Campylobacter canadensis]MBZ8002082.1 lipopolysaccharide heptosyltransferase I [Campylobacter canadensis]MBZ8004078.1 lipopolysaccharide heptosyltransferase I [Campylobacter canadensis]